MLEKALIQPWEGMAIVVAFWVASLAGAALLSKYKGMGKNEFLVAGRSLGVWEGALSVAATWIWAPALFIAAQKAYTHGIAGVFWFTAPNVLCLMVFAPFARRIRDKCPEGFTLTAYMRERHSPRVHFLYLFQMTGLAACSFAVQLLAGGMVLSAVTGVDFFFMTLILAIAALSYSLLGGIRSSVITDFGQMILILVIGFLATFWVLSATEARQGFFLGLGGITGEFSSLFSKKGMETALVFGLPVTIGLMAGPFGDQSFWQRAFSIKKEKVGKAFFKGALLFGIVPLCMSVLGFVAAGMKWNVEDPALVNIFTVVKMTPSWMLIPFMIMLLSGLISTLDSNLCAVSGFGGHDFSNTRGQDETSLKSSRISMLLLALVGLLIANIPGMKILYLFLFYGILRASTFLPTVITLTRNRVSESGTFWGILASITLGLPVFAYGNFTGNTLWIVVGSLGALLLSGGTVLVASYFSERPQPQNL